VSDLHLLAARALPTPTSTEFPCRSHRRGHGGGTLPLLPARARPALDPRTATTICTAAPTKVRPVSCMRQPTIRSCFGHPDASIPRAKDGTLEVWDLFCCGGGFSAGAKRAGCAVVYACDSWPEALDAYRRNHPQTHTQCLKLPAPIPFPDDGRPFHVHGSPPCQSFTAIGRMYNTENSIAHATNLVEWFIETAVTCGATSWSMEQVSSPETRAIVDAVRARHPTLVSSETIDLYELGVPQHRKRLICGSPELVAHLLRMCSAKRHRSIRDTIARPRGTMVRNNCNWTQARLRLNRKLDQSKYAYTKATDSNCALFPLTGPSPTIVCNGNTRWWWRDENGKGKSAKLSVRDAALLQTFPIDYEWPTDVMLARKLVGNAVPPLVAELLLMRPSVR
jgi:DNA (cytosine-5)-methyltransferase 1